MGIEDEQRSRAAAMGPDGQESRRPSHRDRDAREDGPERAVEDVRQVAVEAGELLRTEGLKPAGLVYVPPSAMSFPLFGHAFSGVKCGYGWHVVRGVVVGTDGRLWARKPVHNPTPQKDLGAWRLEVEPPTGRVDLPRLVEFDGVSLHTVRRISDDEHLKVDLINRPVDGYARLLVLHHGRRS